MHVHLVARGNSKTICFMACSARSFTDFLVDQQPHYDEMIWVDITPRDGLVMHISTGTQKAGVGTVLYQDRLHSVYPDTTQKWNAVTNVACEGSPCDPTETKLGMGASRRNYNALTQSWASQLFCYDAMLPISNPKETFEQYVTKILRPSTVVITSQLIRKSLLLWADKKWVANATMEEFTFEWAVIPGTTQEAYLYTNKIPTSVLTPQMLQRRFEPLMNRGFFGTTPYSGKGNLPLAPLITDLDTLWQLDHLGGATGHGNGPTITGNWRFTQWDAAHEFWRYGLSGQIGNYAAQVDAGQLRFNLVSATSMEVAGKPYKFQLILPMRNVASTGAGQEPGLKEEYNPDYQNAWYRMSFIHHQKSIELLTQENTTINSQMPFLKRNFGGGWQWVMDNLTDGCDTNGNPIAVDNKRRNKGQFIADFRYWVRPARTEWEEAIFHLGAPQCVSVVPPCGTQPGYPTQNYDSGNEPCPTLD